MTIQEIKNTPKIVDFMLDKSVIEDSRMKLRKRLEEICELAIKALEQQPCEDTISRQEAIRVAEQGQIQGYIWQFKKLCALPPVEPERKTGKWFLLDECANEGWYCDQCHKKVFKADFSNTMRKYKFCPNCGVKMEVN